MTFLSYSNYRFGLPSEFLCIFCWVSFSYNPTDNTFSNSKRNSRIRHNSNPRHISNYILFFAQRKQNTRDISAFHRILDSFILFTYKHTSNAILHRRLWDKKSDMRPRSDTRNKHPIADTLYLSSVRGVERGPSPPGCEDKRPRTPVSPHSTHHPPGLRSVTNRIIVRPGSSKLHCSAERNGRMDVVRKNRFAFSDFTGFQVCSAFGEKRFSRRRFSDEPARSLCALEL